MHSPRVSVFIGTYNHARFLPACLDSILAQTFQDFEIVIVDDGSTDNTREILAEYQCRFPERFRPFTHQGNANRGFSASCNLAISKARGEYLAWIGSDDIWYPYTLERQVAQLDADAHQAFVYGYAHFIDAFGNRLPGLYGVDVTRDPNPVGRMLLSCHPPAMTTMIRRKCLEKIGLLDEKLVYSDWELWIRLLAHCSAGFIGTPLAMYRIHGQNMSKGIDPRIDLEHTLAMMLAIRRKSAGIGGALMLPRNLALLDLQIAFLQFCSGNEEEAVENLHRAFEHDPGLNEDADFINEWLDSWKGDFYSPSLRHFGFWVMAKLPEGIGAEYRDRLIGLQLDSEATKSFFVRRGMEQGQAGGSGDESRKIFWDCPREVPIPWAWKAEVLKEVYSALMFEAARTGNYGQVRLYWRKAVRYNPALVFNRGFWALGIRAFSAGRSDTGSTGRRGIY